MHHKTQHNMQQTIRQYMETLPQPHRDRAIKNVIAQNGDEWLEYAPSEDLVQVTSHLSGAFSFRESPEGYEYWILVDAGRYDEAEALISGKPAELQPAGKTFADFIAEATVANGSDKTAADISARAKDLIAHLAKINMGENDGSEEFAISMGFKSLIDAAELYARYKWQQAAEAQREACCNEHLPDGLIQLVQVTPLVTYK